jgi:hypothetical protein
MGSSRWHASLWRLATCTDVQHVVMFPVVALSAPLWVLPRTEMRFLTGCRVLLLQRHGPFSTADARFPLFLINN